MQSRRFILWLSNIACGTNHTRWLAVETSFALPHRASDMTSFLDFALMLHVARAPSRKISTLVDSTAPT